MKNTPSISAFHWMALLREESLIALTRVLDYSVIFRKNCVTATSNKPLKQINDQAAILKPKNVQSTAAQSPVPLNIIAKASLSGKVWIINSKLGPQAGT